MHFSDKKRGGQDVPLFPISISFQAEGQWPHIMSPLPNEARLMNKVRISQTDHRGRTCFREDHMVIQAMFGFPFLVFVFLKLLFQSFSSACSIHPRRFFTIS